MTNVRRGQAPPELGRDEFHQARNDGTCPGEISKTFRLVQLAQDVLQSEGIGRLSGPDRQLKDPRPK